MTLRFAAIGLAHYHIFNFAGALRDAGVEIALVYDELPEMVAEFQAAFPTAVAAPSMEAILEDASIHIIGSAAIPNQRAKIGIRAMQHGKDFISAKPSFTNIQDLDEARRVQAETGRIYSVFYGERFGNRATVKAGELVHAGAIGRVVQTIGFGPHRLLGHTNRPDWTFDRQFFGGIINDLASHQVDQFLYFTGSTSGEIATSQVGNFKFSQFPKMHDFGDLVVRSPTATGYIRVDWLTPQGLPTWGDVRLFIQGTEGYIELRKNVDISGREGDNHLFLVDNKGMQHVDCTDVVLPFGKLFVNDVQNRTETAMTQAHCFLASELALQAEIQAYALT